MSLLFLHNHLEMKLENIFVDCFLCFLKNLHYQNQHWKCCISFFTHTLMHYNRMWNKCESNIYINIYKMINIYKCLCVRLVPVLTWRRRDFPLQQQHPADVASSPRLQTPRLPGATHTVPHCLPAAPLTPLR